MSLAYEDEKGTPTFQQITGFEPVFPDGLFEDEFGEMWPDVGSIANIKSPRLKKAYKEAWRGGRGGGPMSPIPEDVSMHGVDLDDIINPPTVRQLDGHAFSTAPPSDFAPVFAPPFDLSYEFDMEFDGLRKGVWGPGLPSDVGERGYSPVPPPNTPVSHLQAPTPPGSLGPYELEAYVEPEPDPFNFWPYLVFGAVLIGLAIITEDPRDIAYV